MENITVTIPAQTFHPFVYLSNDNCYLAQALKNAGYTNIIVIDHGRCKIGDQSYRPIEHFDSFVVESAFERGEDITVTLQPV